MGSFIFRCAICGRLAERTRDDYDSIEALLDLVEFEDWGVTIEPRPKEVQHTIRCKPCRSSRLPAPGETSPK